MNKIDWSQFKKRIAINCDINQIFSAWTTQENLEKWFLSLAEFANANEPINRNTVIKPGNTYKWMWHGSDNVAEGKIIANNGENYLEFTFLGNIVSVNFIKEGNYNLIELIQSKINLDEESKIRNYVGCTRGWTFYLANLKSILEGGIDLRNKDLNLRDVLNS